MRFPQIPTMETERLTLRRLRLTDARDYFDRIGSSAAVTRFMTFNPHTSLDDSIASMEKTLRRYESGESYRWGITVKGDDRIIGVFDLLTFDREKNTCCFAYMLGENWWGRGYGTEAMLAAFRFAFEEMGVERIAVDHFSENAASGAVMRKAGMRHTGTRVAAYEKNGVKHDAECYELTREEWNRDHQ